MTKEEEYLGADFVEHGIGKPTLTNMPSSYKSKPNSPTTPLPKDRAMTLSTNLTVTDITDNPSTDIPDKTEDNLSQSASVDGYINSIYEGEINDELENKFQRKISRQVNEDIEKKLRRKISSPVTNTIHPVDDLRRNSSDASGSSRTRSNNDITTSEFQNQLATIY